jgi:hypothetical protein
MDTLSRLLNAKKASIYNSFPADAREAYENANRALTTSAPVRTNAMLSHDGELITKEKFAALFSDAWKEKLEETRGQR